MVYSIYPYSIGSHSATMWLCRRENEQYVWTDSLAWDPGSHGYIYTSKELGQGHCRLLRPTDTEWRPSMLLNSFTFQNRVATHRLPTKSGPQPVQLFGKSANWLRPKSCQEIFLQFYDTDSNILVSGNIPGSCLIYWRRTICSPKLQFL